MSKQQIGVVGMAVMGRNLALNIESRGYTVSIFNRSREKTEEVIAENPGKKLVPYYTVKEFVESLETPRRILLMVKAGAGTDAAIDSSSHTSIKVTSLLMVVIPSSRTLFVVIVSFLQKALTSSVRVFLVVKKVR
ncbi:6-phosphogluconate dehydrogenase [Escherichia coli]|uniref:6-phosphogluconate dehydrogenase n=1 Tax=Escherichia coli TaxID=562 RepID=A0A377B989_ECOLX|nr:6-phosphogluconate dehydrogenase [Escherichia coli]